MHVFGMGTAEIVVILFIVLLLFGPKNLPKLGRSIGKTIRAVKEGVQEGKDDAKSPRGAQAAAGYEGEGVQGPVGAARQKETALEAICEAGDKGEVERETAYFAADGMGAGRKRPNREDGMPPGGQKRIESETGTGCDALAAMKSA